jgi:hypothetical protein
MRCLSRSQFASVRCLAEYGTLAKVIGGHTSLKVTPLIIDDIPDSKIPIIFVDFRSERLSNRRGYWHLLSYIAGYDRGAGILAKILWCLNGGMSTKWPPENR